MNSWYGSLRGKKPLDEFTSVQWISVDEERRGYLFDK